MERRDLERRTKNFALRIVRFVSGLPKNKVTDVLGYQLLKSGTSVGANYREANRAASHDDFIHKVGIVEKEASESQYWLELMEEAEIGDSVERAWLVRECGELLAIFNCNGPDGQVTPDHQNRHKALKPVQSLSLMQLFSSFAIRHPPWVIHGSFRHPPSAFRHTGREQPECA